MINPKISLLPVLSHINNVASFVKVKISYFQTRFRNELWLLESRWQWADFFLCIERRLTHCPVKINKYIMHTCIYVTGYGKTDHFAHNMIFQ